MEHACTHALHSAAKGVMLGAAMRRDPIPLIHVIHYLCH
jgi:hypothetical protein